MFYTVADSCILELKAYSAYNSPWRCTPDIRGYVRLNGEDVWQASWCGAYPSHRGFNTLLVNPINCTVHESRQFDTFASSVASQQLSAYLQQVCSDIHMIETKTENEIIQFY